MVDRMGEPAVKISPLHHPMYVQGYTAALRDVEAQLTNIEEDLRLHKRRQNAKTFRAFIRCMIENRTALREKPNAFIRCNDNTKDGFELWWEGRKMDNSGDTTNPSTISYDYLNCPYKLPCGYCTKLYMDCPRRSNSVTTPYWSLDKITCSTEEKHNG